MQKSKKDYKVRQNTGNMKIIIYVLFFIITFSPCFGDEVMVKDFLNRYLSSINNREVNDINIDPSHKVIIEQNPLLLVRVSDYKIVEQNGRDVKLDVNYYINNIEHNGEYGTYSKNSYIYLKFSYEDYGYVIDREECIRTTYHGAMCTPSKAEFLIK